MNSHGIIFSLSDRRDQLDSVLPRAKQNLANFPFSAMFTEVEYRIWLEEIFRSSFEGYDGAIPAYTLMQFFQYDNFGIPKNKLADFMKKMDHSMDGRITFQEFHRSMVHKRRSDLNRSNRFMLDVALITNPALKKKAIANKEVDAVDGLEAGLLLEKDTEIPESYMDVYNCKPPPIFIPVIVIAQIITFVIYAIEINKRAEQEPLNVLTFTTGLPYWSPLIYDPAKRYQAWRFFSYSLIHQGIFHILFNSLIQIVLGIPLEFSDKGLRVGAVYLFGVCAGSLTSSMVDSTVLLVGSSGGSHALLGAHLALVVMNWRELQYRWLKLRESIVRFLFSGCMRLVYILLIIAIDYGVTFYQRFGVPQGTTRISYAAHLGGLIMGFLVGLIVLKNVSKIKWEIILKWVALSLVIAFYIIAVLFNVFYPGFPKQLW